MTSFSPETLRVLEANGWREDRRVDVSAYEQALRSAGYEDFQAASAFLQRYGDLEVDAGVGDICLTTIMSDIMKTVPVWNFSRVPGRPLCLYIVGSCRYDFMCLMMDSAGRVYRCMYMTCQNFGGIDLYRIATSGEEAIEKLVQEDQTGVDLKGTWMLHRD